MLRRCLEDATNPVQRHAAWWLPRPDASGSQRANHEAVAFALAPGDSNEIANPNGAVAIDDERVGNDQVEQESGVHCESIAVQWITVALPVYSHERLCGHRAAGQVLD